MRLDIYLQNLIERKYDVKLSRTYVERILEKGGVTYQDEVIKKKGFSFDPGKQVPELNEELVRNMLSVYQTGKRQDEEAEAWDASEKGIELDENRVKKAADIRPFIVLETDDLLAVNKPPGVSSHPGKGDRGADSMVYQFIKYMRQAHQYIPRAGLLHRLDKDTQGILLFAKNMQTYNEIKSEFEQRQVQKYYVALCKKTNTLQNNLKQQLAFLHKNNVELLKFTDYPTTEVAIEKIVAMQRPVKLEGYIGRRRGTPFMVYTHDAKIAESLVGSRDCFSNVYVVFDDEEQLQLLFAPHTGRTHQIRAQARYLGCSIENDRIYGDKNTLGGTLGLFAVQVNFSTKGKSIQISLPKEKISIS